MGTGLDGAIVSERVCRVQFWTAVAGKAIDCLTMLGVVSLGIQVGIICTMMLVSLSFEGSAMQNYPAMLLVESPMWFKRLFMWTALASLLGILRLVTPAISVVETIFKSIGRRQSLDG